MTDSDRKRRSTNKVGKIDAVGSDNAKMADKVIHESMRSNTSWSRSEIQLIQSRFKSIRFNDGKRSQARELIRDEDAMTDVVDIPGDADNCLLLKNNVEYEWARFMQASKMTKVSMTIFFSNPTLALIREHLSYKNMVKIRALLKELPYGKIT